MYNQFDSMNEYNNDVDIDSIGSEAPYDDTMDESTNIDNKNITIRSQNGGRFLDFIFGKSEDENSGEIKLSNTETTALIMKAIETGRYEAADFLLEQKFVPDLTYVNQKKDNLLHELVKARDKLRHSNQALQQLIESAAHNSKNKEALNTPDVNGMTPFYIAIKKGYNDVARYMSEFGAKRITPTPDQDIVTEKSDDDNEEQNYHENQSNIYETNTGRSIPIDVATLTQSMHTTQTTPLQSSQTSPTIFSKSSHYSKPNMVEFSAPMSSSKEQIADIVRAFGSRSAAESDMPSIRPSHSESERENMKEKLEHEIDEKMMRLHSLINATIPSSSTSTSYVPSISTKFSSIPSMSHVSSKSMPGVFGESPISSTQSMSNMHQMSNIQPMSNMQHMSNTQPMSNVQHMSSMHSKSSHVKNPLEGIMSDQPSEEFVELLTNKLAGIEPNSTTYTQHLEGGAKKRQTKHIKKTKKNNEKLERVTKTRDMVRFSELNEYDEYDDMMGGMSDNEMKNIARATSNQKEKLHEEAVNKILSHLPTKDILLARAIKGIIYKEVKDTHKEMTGLDKAAEMLKLITKSKVDEVLKQKDEIKKRVAYFEEKNKEKNKTSNKSKMNRSNKNNKNNKISRTMPDLDFESSVTDTSDYESSGDSSSSMSTPEMASKKGKKKTKHMYDY